MASFLDNENLRFLFGNKEQAGAIPVATNAIGGVINAWLGYENLQLQKDQTSMAKQQFQQNMEMANMEAALKLDARKRGLAQHGISSDVLNKYANKFQ